MKKIYKQYLLKNLAIDAAMVTRMQHAITLMRDNPKHIAWNEQCRKEAKIRKEIGMLKRRLTKRSSLSNIKRLLAEKYLYTKLLQYCSDK